MKLSDVTAQLEGMEETIISALIERAQFSANQAIYRSQNKPQQEKIGWEVGSSFFESWLFQWEKMETIFGCFLFPEERPFSAGLPKIDSTAGQIRQDAGLMIEDFDTINLTGEIRNSYIRFLPQICSQGDDGLYCRCVKSDIMALKAISRRIHLGAFLVGECKYRSDSGTLRPLIKSRNNDAISSYISRSDVEKRILKRVRTKTDQIQRSINRNIRVFVKPEKIELFYSEAVIPLTKRGEVHYILNRLQD